jgi:hypothetical protein
MIFSKIKDYFKTWFDFYVFTPDEKALRTALATWPRLSTSGAPVKVLVQIVREHGFLIKFLYCLWALRDQAGPLQIDWVIVDQMRLEPTKLKAKILYWLLTRPSSFRKPREILRTAGGEIVSDTWMDYKNTTARSEADTLWKNLTSKKDLEALVYQDLSIGDLIYDTYLRYRPAPTVDLKDPYLRDLIAWSLVLVHRFEKLFKDHKYDYYLTSYTSYISHGILARMALKQGVRVYSAGAFNQMLVEPYDKFPFHKRHFLKYQEWWNQMADPVKALSEGQAILKNRIAGVIDDATYYMKSSAYGSNTRFEELPPKTRSRALIMGHDFFDSPHVYGPMVFPDFWEWIQFLFDEAKTAPADFFYKPHPNALPENIKIIEELKRKNPHIYFLDPKISNRFLAEKGEFEAAYTVYGTIAHEFAFLGVPVICAGSNPHMGFSFCKTVLTKTEFRDWIHNFMNKTWVPDQNQVEAFCYLHNLRFLKNEIQQFPMFPTYLEAAELVSEPRRKALLELWKNALKTTGNI